MNTMPTRFIRALYRSGIRGRTRITLFLACRLKSLQSVPVELASGATMFADLRLLSTHGVFLGWIPGAEDEDVIGRILLPGDTAFDIGAHIGLYSILFSKLVGSHGKVFSFEINPEVLPNLEKTVGLLDNVALFSCGLGDKNEPTVLYVPEDPSAASLKDWTNGALGSVHTVKGELRRLDDLIKAENIPSPDFIKIDVEGAEELVFLGARDVLDREDAPIIFFEVSTKASKGFGLEETSTMEFLRKLSRPRYSFYDGRGAGNKITRIDRIPPPNAGALAVNILAIPESRINRVPSGET